MRVVERQIEHAVDEDAEVEVPGAGGEPEEAVETVEGSEHPEEDDGRAGRPPCRERRPDP